MQDTINETAVWNRVTAASRSGDGTQEKTGPIGPELLAALEREQDAARQYRALVGRTAGEVQRTLRTVFRQSQQQAQSLSALYFFLTGQRPSLPSAPPGTERRESLSEALRRQMQAEEVSLGRLEALAGRSTGETRETLLTLSRQDRQQFHRLLSVLGQSLSG